MRRSLLLLALLLMGCAGKQGPNSPVGHRTGAIPIKCVQEAVLTPKSACYATTDPDWFNCDGIGVKAACITYSVTPVSGDAPTDGKPQIQQPLFPDGNVR